MRPTSAARSWATSSGKNDARSDRRSAAPECIRPPRLRAAPAVLHAAAARAVPQSDGSVCYSADKLDRISGAAPHSRPHGNRLCDDSSCVAGAGADAHAAPAVARQDARERFRSRGRAAVRACGRQTPPSIAVSADRGGDTARLIQLVQSSDADWAAARLVDASVLRCLPAFHSADRQRGPVPYLRSDRRAGAPVLDRRRSGQVLSTWAKRSPQGWLLAVHAQPGAKRTE